MDFGEHIIPSSRLWPGEQPWDGPFALVRLGERDAPEHPVLPPCPVIGLGDPDDPLGSKLDAVIEAPVTVEAVARQVLARPRTAAVIVQLLRLLPLLPMEEGLVVESMAYALLQGSAEHAAWLAAQPPRAVPPTEGGIAMERRDEKLVVTLAHPENANAIDRSMRDALAEAFALAALDPTIARVSLRAEGRAFSLGAEISEFGTTTDPATAHAIRRLTLPARNAARIADRLDVHVQGACVGSGLELAAFAQRITATRDAWFRMPELTMGILPGAGGCVSLTRRIGRQRTALLILSGKRLTARQALAWGLVDEIVDDPA